jgi:hypothetical protein
MVESEWGDGCIADAAALFLLIFVIIAQTRHASTRRSRGPDLPVGIFLL